MYCGACGIYRAYRDNGEFLKKLAGDLKCPPERIKCEGYGALTPNSWGYNCKIAECTTNKDLEFCHQCTQYQNNSCEKFEKLAQRYLEAKEDLRANLERIRKGQTKEWLHECEEKYRCSECEKPLPVYGIKGKCYHCGANLPKNYAKG